MIVNDSIIIVRWMIASTRLAERDVELSVVAVIGRSVDDNALSFITNLSFECGRAENIHAATTRRGERDDPEHATSLAPASRIGVGPSAWMHAKSERETLIARSESGHKEGECPQNKGRSLWMFRFEWNRL